VPCFLGGMARGLLGKANPLQMRHCRKDALKDADVVILLGTVCDFRLGYGKVLSRKSKIITVNRNHSQLTKVCTRNKKSFLFTKLLFLESNTEF
jgi:acetolactate synthase-like protein